MKQLYSLHNISVSLLLLSFSLSVDAIDPYRIAGASDAGSGFACTMKSGLWSSFLNQASLAENKVFEFGINYQDRFNIPELGTQSAALIIPAGKASLGAVYNHSGYSEFNRQMAGLACGMKLSDKIAAGLQVDYFCQLTEGEYENPEALSFEAGIIISPTENIRLGMHAFNPLPSTYGKFLPSAFSAGAGIYLSRILFGAAEVEMVSGNLLCFRTGFDYEAAKKVKLRAGFCSRFNSFTFGFGYLLKPVQIDLGFMTHDRLGITSSASLIFRIK